MRFHVADVDETAGARSAPFVAAAHALAAGVDPHAVVLVEGISDAVRVRGLPPGPLPARRGRGQHGSRPSGGGRKSTPRKIQSTGSLVDLIRVGQENEIVGLRVTPSLEHVLWPVARVLLKAAYLFLARRSSTSYRSQS
jgi:hypothetical protein